jgi:rhodanese-related sulfurtransferase
MFAKFIPGVATLAAALAGTVGIRYSKFLLFDAIGAILWVGVAVGAGYMSRAVIGDVLQWIPAVGKWILVAAAGVLAAYILCKWWQRRSFMKKIQMERISVDRLRQMMQEKAPAILDVRPEVIQSMTSRIPGARLISLDRIAEGIADLTPSDEIVVYCSCPNEATAATLTRELWERGFRNARPLQGGIDAWTRAGFPVEPGLSSPAQ